MKVKWTEHSLSERNHVANYIRRQFGPNRKICFLQEVRQTTKLLKTHPNLGLIDPLFNDRPQTYRSVIINGLSKMVYRIDGDIISIVGFWDTRCEPEKQAKRVK